MQFLPALGGRGWERGKAEASSKEIKASKLRGTVVTKALLRVQFLPALGGRGWERGKAKASSSALLSKKGWGGRGL